MSCIDFLNVLLRKKLNQPEYQIISCNLLEFFTKENSVVIDRFY